MLIVNCKKLATKTNGYSENSMEGKLASENLQFAIHSLLVTVCDFQGSGRGAAW